MKKIIIWLFEKYAFDYWVEQQEEEDAQRKKLKTEEFIFKVCPSCEIQIRAYSSAMTGSAW